jgi:copper(I)-binding protein
MPKFESILHRAIAAAVPALLIVLVLAPLTSAAQVVTITNPWVRGTVAEQKVTGAFMTLTAPGESRLVEVRSPVAGTVEIHEMKMDGNVMRMRPISALVLPRGKPVELKPGGYHVMLMGLNTPLQAGRSIPVKLTFELADKKRETIALNVEVRDLKGNARSEQKGRHAH